MQATKNVDFLFFLFFLLICEISLAQESIQEFEITDSVRADLRIEESDLKVDYFPSGKSQIIIDDPGEITDVQIADINLDGFADSRYTKGWKEFSFHKPFEVHKTKVWKELLMPGLELDLSKTEQYGPDGTIKSLDLFQYGYAVENLYAYVQAEKTELNAAPQFGTRSKGYLVKDDEAT